MLPVSVQPFACSFLFCLLCVLSIPAFLLVVFSVDLLLNTTFDMIQLVLLTKAEGLVFVVVFLTTECVQRKSLVRSYKVGHPNLDFEVINQTFKINWIKNCIYLSIY